VDDMTAQWPEPPAERKARKERVRKQKTAKRREVEEIDTRTPSGKPLPY
jgi:hypothetical protein